ncbi:MAG: DUF2189 domain-containing protein [Rhodobacteraceae bacterium]|nr:DUF2189 domain-containing protein [Paracoccaceae bacterium]
MAITDTFQSGVAGGPPAAVVDTSKPDVRVISLQDIKDAVNKGIEDFSAKPTHLFILVPLYPFLAFCAFLFAGNKALLPLIFPVATGLVLIGPFIAIGLYEFSHRRERGLDLSWRNAFDFWHSPALPNVMFLGVVLVALFFAWLMAAMLIFVWTIGRYEPQTIVEVGELLFTTSAGWSLIIFGNLVGLGFALAAMSISVVSFPMLLDRNCSVARAVHTSVRVVAKNPVPMAAWGLVVAASLFVGALPLFVGHAVVIPVLAHATWHLYRKAVA